MVVTGPASSLNYVQDTEINNELWWPFRSLQYIYNMYCRRWVKTHFQYVSAKNIHLFCPSYFSQMLPCPCFWITILPPGLHVREPMLTISRVSVLHRWHPGFSWCSLCQGQLAWVAVDSSQPARPDGPLCTHYLVLIALWRRGHHRWHSRAKCLGFQLSAKASQIWLFRGQYLFIVLKDNT